MSDIMKDRRKVFYPHNPERRKTDEGRRVLICSKCGNEIQSSKYLGEFYTHSKNDKLMVVLCRPYSVELAKKWINYEDAKNDQ